MSTDWPYDPETGEIVDQPKPNIAEYSVTEISHALKKTLEETFGHVRVRGESIRIPWPPFLRPLLFFDQGRRAQNLTP